MSQVTCRLPGCVYALQGLWFDSCFRAAPHVHADRAWLSPGKFQTWKLEAHCELKVALGKKKKSCLSSKQRLLACYQSRERPLDIFNLSVQTTDEDSEACKV